MPVHQRATLALLDASRIAGIDIAGPEVVVREVTAKDYEREAATRLDRTGAQLAPEGDGPRSSAPLDPKLHIGVILDHHRYRKHHRRPPVPMFQYNLVTLSGDRVSRDPRRLTEQQTAEEMTVTGPDNARRSTGRSGRPKLSDSPLKVTPEVKDLVRYGSAVFGWTQGEFVERAVAEYLRLHKEEVAERARAVNARAEQLG